MDAFKNIKKTTQQMLDQAFSLMDYANKKGHLAKNSTHLNLEKIADKLGLFNDESDSKKNKSKESKKTNFKDKILNNLDKDWIVKDLQEENLKSQKSIQYNLSCKIEKED